MGKPKVPNTISDAQQAALARRRQTRGELMFSRKAVAQRKASEQQRRNAGKN